MSASEVTAVRTELEDGWAEVAARPPHSALRALVRRYWGYTERYGGRVQRRELPSSDVVLILSLGPSMELLHDRTGGVAETHDSFVAGLTETSVVTAMDGASDGLQVNLSPLGAYALLGVPMHSLSNCTVALDALLGPRSSSLVERLQDAPTWGSRFDLLDVVLLERLERGPRPSAETAFAWRRLIETRGAIHVHDLADEAGWSRKHLAGRFREEVGLPPKAVARILRFERAVEEILSDRARSWADVAVECGYYDQAHFNRDFRQFAGSSPTEFLARQRPEGLGLAPA